MNKLSFKRVVLAAVAVTILVPALSFAEVNDPIAASLALMTAELKETYTPEKLRALPPEERSQVEKLLATLASVPKIADAVKKTNTWKGIQAEYKALQDRGAKRYDAEVKKRFADATNEQKQAGQISSDAGTAFAQAEQKLNDSEMPEECKFNADYPSAIAAFKGLDQDAGTARAKGQALADKAKKKAKQEFQDGLAAQFAKAMGQGAPNDDSAEKLKKLQELAATMKDPEQFLKLAEATFKDAKDKALAEETATKIFYLDPENGLLARLERLQENDSEVAAFAQATAADLKRRYGLAITQFGQAISNTEVDCNEIKTAIGKDAKAVEVGMKRNAIEFAGENGDELEGNIAAEKGKLIKARNSMFCDGSRVRTHLATMQADVEAKSTALQSETKNPQVVRARINEMLRIAPDNAPLLTASAESVNFDCKVGTQKWKKLMEGSNRKAMAEVGKGKRKPTNPQQLLGGTAPRVPGQPGPGPVGPRQAPTHNGV